MSKVTVIGSYFDNESRSYKEYTYEMEEDDTLDWFLNAPKHEGEWTIGEKVQHDGIQETP